MPGENRPIGELARESGVTVRTLRYYDQVGVLAPSARSPGGHRAYSDEDVRRLHRITALRGFGFSLAEIKDMLVAEPRLDPAELIRRQLVVLDERMRQAASLRARLIRVLDALESSAEQSTKEFLRLIEETITMNEPLTPERVTQLVEARRREQAGLTAAEQAELSHQREESFAGLDDQERDRLRGRLHAAYSPPAGG